MSYWSGSPADRQRARMTLNTAEPDRSAEVNSAALEWGLFLFWTAISIALAVIVAAYVEVSIVGQRAGIVFVVAIFPAALAGRILNHRNRLRASRRMTAGERRGHETRSLDAISIVPS